MADEGLRWLLDLDVKDDEALSFLKTLDKMTAALKVTGAEVDHVEAASAHAAKGHKKHGDSAEHLGGILHHVHKAVLEPFLEMVKQVAEFEFIRRGIDALIEAPMEMIEKLKELGAEMVNTAAKAQRTERSFGLMFGHEGAEEMLEYVNKIRRATEFTAEELEGGVSRLGKVGFKGEGLGRALSAAQDLAALDPDKAGGFSSAIEGLDQAKRTGMVNNRTLRPLGIGENDFLKELSARTGTSTATLKKQIAAGKVDTEESLETLFAMITKKTGKKLGEAGVDMSKTLGAQLTHLGELPELFMKKLATSGATDKITNSLSKLLDRLDPNSPDGKLLFSTLENMFNNMASILDKFVRFMDWAEKFFGVHDNAGPAAPTGAILPSVDYDAMGNPIGELPVEDVAKKVGEAVGKGMAQGMENSAAVVTKAAEQLAEAASGATRKRLGVQSPSKVFADIGRMTAAGFVEGIDAGADSVDQAIGQMFPSPKVSAGAGVGSKTIQVAAGAVSISISVPHGTSSATAEAMAAEVGRAVESILPGALESALASIALQGGAS